MLQLSKLMLGSRYPVEFVLLIGLAFVLPIFEPPKNVLWAAFVATWVYNRFTSGQWGGKWGTWDTIIALWILSGYVVAIFAGIAGQEFKGANDILRYGSIFWCMLRSGYKPHEIRLLTGTLILSCVVGLGWGAWRYFFEGQYLELHSVGHVNHSAPYIAMSLSLVAGMLVFGWRSLSPLSRSVLTISALLILLALVATSSRGAIGAALSIPIVLILGVWHRSRKTALILAVFAGCIVGLTVLMNADVVKKQQQLMERGDFTNSRIGIWRRAVIAWEIHPWFGVGMRNFSRIDDEMVRQHVESKGMVFNSEEYRSSNHAHSLYFNTLAERGLVGGGMFLVVLLAMAWKLWAARPKLEGSDTIASLWAAAASSWTIAVIAGFGNTSFHHEIAILAVMLWGAWMNLERQNH